MAKEEKKNRKSKDGDGSGGCCGTVVGCFVIFAVAGAVLAGLVLLPYLREHDWSLSTLGDRAREYRDRAASFCERLRNCFDEAKENPDAALHDLQTLGRDAENSLNTMRENASGTAEHAAPDDARKAENVEIEPVLIED